MPADAVVVVRQDGFEARHREETIADVRWDLVQVVFAYTRYIGGRGALCLAFVLPPPQPGRQEDQVVVNDKVGGWPALVSGLSCAFPSLDKSWAEKAACDCDDIADIAPAFTASPVEVWRRGAAQRR
jgi:hypothetical protein